MIPIRFHAWDIQAAMPKLSDLTKLREDLSAEGFKKFAQACIPNALFREILKSKPAAGFTLGKIILEACGGRAEVYELDEADLDEATAAAFVAAEAKKFQGLKVITIGFGVEEHVLIVRAANEKNCDQYFKTESAEAAQTLCKTCVVYPDPLDFDRTAPGLYLGIAKYIVEQAGFHDEAVLGEV